MSEVSYIDRQAEPNSPSSRFLRKEEFKDVMPSNMQNRLNFIFRHDIPQKIDVKVGKLLMRKYPSIIFLNKEDNLDRMKYKTLKKLAVKKGIQNKDTFVKRDILIEMIRTLNR